MFVRTTGKHDRQRAARLPKRWLLAAAITLLLGLMLPLAASAFISTGSTNNKSWYWQNPLPQGNSLNGLSFADANTGWAAGLGGTVLKTVDGGVTWLPEDCGSLKDLWGTTFADSSNGWVVGLSGTIRHTTDGGNTWAGQTLGAANFRAVASADSNSAIAVGDRGTTTSTIGYTKNGGTTWAYGQTSSTAALSGVAMSSATLGWAVGSAGTILKTTDGGVTWTALTSGTTVGLTSIAAVKGTTTAYVVGNVNGSAATILKTTNGTTWTSLSLGTGGNYNGVAVNADGTQVTVVSSTGVVYRSNNGGTSWTAQSPVILASTALRAVQMPDNSHVTVVGDTGVMFSSINSGTNWTSQMQGVTAALNATWFANSSKGWIVGASGTIMRTLDGGVSWDTKTVTNNALRSVMFLDALNGWAVGANGTIVHTTDGGATWATQSSGTTSTQFNGVWFKDASNGLAVGNGGVLKVTSNGGSTWTTGTAGTASNLNAIWFADANNGFIAGSGGAIRRTTDGGTTWTTSTSGTTQTLYAIRGVDATHVWAVGNNGVALKTTNGGTSTWTALTANTGTTQPLYSAFFTDVNHGWIGGNYGTFKYTSDGGTTWTSQPTGLPTNTAEVNTPVRGIFFPTGSSGFIVGDQGSIRKTVNTGATWTSAQQGTLQSLNSVQFTDANTGWAVGNAGALLTTKDGGQSWLGQRTGSSANFNAVSMVDSLTGWMAGSGGTIRKTTDGVTWVGQTSNTTQIFSGLSSYGSQAAIAAGAAGTIRYTKDGGATWLTPTTVPTTQGINGVWMTSASTAYAVTVYATGSPNVIKTTDGGVTWAALSPSVNQPSSLYSVVFVNSSVGFITGNSGLILKTIDGGATWVKQTTPGAVQLRSTAFADVNNGWAIGTVGTVYRTTNGGSTWVLQQSGTMTNQLNSIAFIDANHGWIAGGGGTLLRTTNQTAPVTTLTTAPPSPNGTNGWYNSAPQVTLTPNIQSTTYYSWTASTGPFAQYASSIAAPEGLKTLYYYSVESGGSQEVTRSASFKCDYTPPTTPLTLSAGSPTTSTVPISWTPSVDAISGVARYDVYVNGVVATSTTTLSTTLSGLSPNTNYSVAIAAVDNAGLSSLPMTPITVTTLDLDRTPLATSIVVSPAAPTGSNSWFTSAPTVSLTTSPTTVASTIHYSWDSATGPWTTYVGAFPAIQGAHTLWYYASDNSGVRHDETPHQIAIKTDTVPPSTPTSVTPGTPGTSTVNVAWGASGDAASGVAYYDVLLNGTLVTSTAGTSAALSGLSPANTYSVVVIAVDNAGLASVPSTAVAFTMQDVDHTPLSTQRTVAPTLPNGQNGWYVSAPTVGLVSTPATNPATTYYSWSSASGPWTSYSATLTAAEGARTLWYYSHDNLGLRADETPKSVTLRSDLTNPTAPSGLIAGAPTTSTVNVSWTPGLESGSGVDYYEVYLNGTLYRSTTSPSMTLTGLTPNTSYSITVIESDVSGRTSLPSLPALIHTPDLDRAPLVTTKSVTPGSPDGSAGWYTTAPAITLTSAPATVPATIYYSWVSNTGPWLAYSGTLHAADGQQTLYFYSHDISGQRNDEAVQQAAFKTDTIGPSSPSAVTASNVTTSAATITWLPSADSASGIDHYNVMVDGSFLRSVTSTGTTLTGLTETTHYQVRIVAVATAGGTAQSSAVGFTTLTIDRTPLVTSAIVDPPTPDGLNGWYVNDPSFTLASSPATVPANTYYSWTGASGPWVGYLPGAMSPGDGESKIWYFSQDVAGERNLETPAPHTSFKVDTIPPIEPSSVLVGAPGTSTVSLTWSGEVAGASPIDHYDVFATDMTTSNVTTFTGTGNGIVLTGLNPSTSYTIEIVANAESGQLSGATALVGFTTLDVDHTPLTTSASFSSPAVPDGLNGWYVTTPTVTLTSEPATVTTVQRYYSYTSASGPWTPYTGPFAPIDGDNTLYFYSHDLTGQRTDETPKSTEVKLDPLVPAATSILTAPIVTHDSVTLSWLPVLEPYSGVDHYEIWDDYIGATTGTQYTVGGLSPQTVYPFSIITVNGAGTRSSSSTTVTIETSNTPLPAAPSNVLAKAPDGGYVLINWAPSSDTVGATSYCVWRSLDGITYSRLATVSGTLNNTYVDANLRSSARYWYAVSTIDSRGESSTSDTSTASWPYTAPFTGRPDRVAGLSTVPGSNTVLLSWAPSSNPAVNNYLVRRTPKSLSSSVTTLAVNNASFPPSLEDTTAANGQVYYYSVCAVDESGTVGYPSVEITATPRSAYTGADTHLINSDGSSKTCWTCHSAHGSPQVGPTGPRLAYTVDGPNEDSLCLSCHSLDSGKSSQDTQSQINDPLKASGHSVWTTSTAGESTTCDDCHRPVGSTSKAPAGLLGKNQVGSVQTGDATCYQCHGQGSTLPYGDMSGFENSGHANVSPPASGSEVKCMACHQAHASRSSHLTTYEGYMVCMQCHTAASTTPGLTDIWTKLTLNDDPNAKHPLLPQDQTDGAKMSCQNCHNTHSTSSQYPLVQPHNPAPGTWTAAPDDQKAFCFTCHNGSRLPTSAETTPWASPVLGSNGATTVVDMENAYNTNVHGFAASNDPTITTQFLRPDMGYIVGDTLDCSACHDPHGTPNNFALVGSVKSAGANKTVDGLLVYKIPAGSITATSPVGYDLRYFCSSCHLFDPATHDPMAHTDTTQFGKNDCTSCHRHVRTNGTPTRRL